MQEQGKDGGDEEEVVVVVAAVEGGSWDCVGRQRGEGPSKKKYELEYD